MFIELFLGDYLGLFPWINLLNIYDNLVFKALLFSSLYR